MRSWHATWSSVGRHPLAPDESVRRRLVRALARVAGRDLVLFCVVNDHIHVVFYCDEARKGMLSGALTHAFRAVSPAPIDRPFVRAVRDRSHLEWLADRYVMRQPWKHGLVDHPALWTGSCFADIAGARVLPGLSLRLLDALPRWRFRRAYSAVFLPETPLAPATDLRLRAVGASRLATAAAATLCAAPDLLGKGAAEVLARRATAVLGALVGIPNSEVGHALGMHPVASARLPARTVDERVLKAVRLRVALEDAVAAAPPPPTPTLTAHEPEGPAYEPVG